MLLLVAMRSRFKMLRLSECLLVAGVVGLSVIVWRSVGNTGALNINTIPGVSPNDVLCPLVTYLFIDFYAAFRPPLYGRCFGQAWVIVKAHYPDRVTQAVPTRNTLARCCPFTSPGARWCLLHAADVSSAPEAWMEEV
jgi:hypothetical protein